MSNIRMRSRSGRAPTPQVGCHIGKAAVRGAGRDTANRVTVVESGMRFETLR